MGWTTTKNQYRVEVIIEKDPPHFLVSSPQLPAAISYGDTKKEALENIKEALTGLIEYYLTLHTLIPWVNTHYFLKDNETRHSVLIDLND